MKLSQMKREVKKEESLVVVEPHAIRYLPLWSKPVGSVIIVDEDGRAERRSVDPNGHLGAVED